MSELTGVILKYVKSAQRNMYLFYPSCERHNPYLTFLVTVLRGESGQSSVENLLNQGLRDFAEEKNLGWLDVNELFDDENGNLRADLSADGAHVLGKYYADWSDWILQKLQGGTVK